VAYVVLFVQATSFNEQNAFLVAFMSATAFIILLFSVITWKININ